jgi:dihydrofolate synthase/folylpolyglutamate synthase
LTKAKEGNSEIYASDLITEDYPSDLIGDYQMHNNKDSITNQVLNKQTELEISSKYARWFVTW